MPKAHSDDTRGMASRRERVTRSRKAAIELFCLECMGGQIQEVKRCTATNCPLYTWRPCAKSADR